MRALLLALLLMPSLASADQENVYDFVFTGSYAPDLPFGTTDVPPDATFLPFTVTFLANSPALPFPGANQPFSASLSAYDVNVVINGQIVLQNGTGGFGFDGAEQLGYQAGQGAVYIGGGWEFSSSALSWFGTPDFGLQFPDRLNGAFYAADNGVAGCHVPPATDTTGPVLCEMGGRSVLEMTPVAAHEPETLALFALGLAGLALMRSRARGGGTMRPVRRMPVKPVSDVFASA